MREVKEVFFCFFFHVIINTQIHLVETNDSITSQTAQ